MALIIKADMPKSCEWSDNTSRTGMRYCPFIDVCKAYRNEVSKQFTINAHPIEYFPSGCPILGEIPNEHGRLKDESVIIENMGNAFDKLFPLDGKHKQTIVSDCHVEFMRAVFKAPTIIDATPVDKLPKEWYDPSEDGLYDNVEASTEEEASK